MTLVSLLLTSVLLSVWLWKAYTLAGRFVAINDSNAYNLFQSNNAYTPLYNTCVANPIDWHISNEFTQMDERIATEPPAVQQGLYRRIAIHHIVSHPGLFFVRTFNRFRAYFCFPAGVLTQNFDAGNPRIWLKLATRVVELCFYWPIMAMAIILCFNLRSFSIPSSSLGVLLGAALVYAFPCWLTCSQPRYNFPVVPIFAALAVTLLDSVTRKSWREVLAPVIESRRRKLAMVLAVAFFFYIQIEWIVIIPYSKTH